MYSIERERERDNVTDVVDNKKTWLLLIVKNNIKKK